MTSLVIIAVAAVLLAGAVTLWLRNARRAGQDAERRKTAERTTDVQSDMLDAAADRPRDGGGVADRMRKRRF